MTSSFPKKKPSGRNVLDLRGKAPVDSSSTEEYKYKGVGHQRSPFFRLVMGAVLVLGLLAVGSIGWWLFAGQNENQAQEPGDQNAFSIPFSELRSQEMEERNERDQQSQSEGQEEGEEQEEQAEEELPRIRVEENSVGWLRVRASATTDSAELGRVYPGEEYEYTEESGAWYRIRWQEGTAGWVHGAYVTPAQ